MITSQNFFVVHLLFEDQPKSPYHTVRYLYRRIFIWNISQELHRQIWYNEQHSKNDMRKNSNILKSYPISIIGIVRYRIKRKHIKNSSSFFSGQFNFLVGWTH